MTTYTSGLRLTNQDTGANPTTWGDIADINFEHIDDAITAQASIDITGGSSHTLTVNNGSDDEARNAALYIHGVPSSANSVIIPSVQKSYLIRTNHTSVAGGITVRTASGTGVNYLTGKTGIIYCDGLSVVSYGNTDETSALDPSANLSDLDNVSAARDNLGLGDVVTLNIGVTSGDIPTVFGMFEIIYPVGSLYSNRTDGTNPGTLIGFGTWTSAGVGRVPIGVGMGIDVNAVSVTITAESCGGEYLHTQTTAEIGSHRHAASETSTEAYELVAAGANNRQLTAGSPNYHVDAGLFTATAGSSEPMNIQQPWYSVYQWVRTA